MARTKKRVHHRTHHRRHRVAGMKDLDAMQLLAIVGGAVGVRVLTTKLAASTNTTMQKLAPYFGIIGGIVIPMVSKNKMLKDVALGMIGGGAISALGSSGLKLIAGIEDTVSGIGYPYNVLPYKKNVAGIVENGNYVSKPNFSGSGKPQMNVIGAIAHMAGGCFDGSAMAYNN